MMLQCHPTLQHRSWRRRRRRRRSGRRRARLRAQEAGAGVPELSGGFSSAGGCSKRPADVAGFAAEEVRAERLLEVAEDDRRCWVGFLEVRRCSGRHLEVRSCCEARQRCRPSSEKMTAAAAVLACYDCYGGAQELEGDGAEVPETRAVWCGDWSCRPTFANFAEVFGKAPERAARGQQKLPGGSGGAATARSADLASAGAGRR